MDRISEHLAVLTLPTVAATGIGAVIVFFLTPIRWRLMMSLASLVVVLSAGQLKDMGTLALLAKAGAPAMYLFVAYAGWSHPGRRRELVELCWLYPILGVIGFLYLQTVEDHSFAFALRLQWTFMTLAAVCVTRTIVDQKSLRRVVDGIAIGASISCLMAASSFIFSHSSFRVEYGRFSPYGVNPNQIGLLFALSVPILLYSSIRHHSALLRILSVIFLVLACGEVILTVSRSALMISTITSAVMLIELVRRPTFVVALGAAAYVAYGGFVGVSEEMTLSHLHSETATRFEHSMDMIEIIRERPYFGLLASQGESAIHSDVNGHNAYLDVLYLGGFSLAIPQFWLFGYGHWCAFRVWRRRKQLPFDPLLVKVLLAMSFCMFVHGFINNILHYPTYAWSFLNVFLSCVFITNSRVEGVSRRSRSAAARRRRRGSKRVTMPTPTAGTLGPTTTIGTGSQKRLPRRRAA